MSNGTTSTGTEVSENKSTVKEDSYSIFIYNTTASIEGATDYYLL